MTLKSDMLASWIVSQQLYWSPNGFLGKRPQGCSHHRPRHSGGKGTCRTKRRQLAPTQTLVMDSFLSFFLSLTRSIWWQVDDDSVRPQYQNRIKMETNTRSNRCKGTHDSQQQQHQHCHLAELHIARMIAQNGTVESEDASSETLQEIHFEICRSKGASAPGLAYILML